MIIKHCHLINAQFQRGVLLGVEDGGKSGGTGVLNAIAREIQPLQCAVHLQHDAQLHRPVPRDLVAAIANVGESRRNVCVAHRPAEIEQAQSPVFAQRVADRCETLVVDVALHADHDIQIAGM